MLPRILKVVLAAVVAAAVWRAGPAHAQLATPLQLASLEWWVAGSDVVVRGVIVDVAADAGNWNIVTLDVLETLKGAKAERLRFAVHKCGQTDAELAQWNTAKRELLWVLKRQDANTAGEAPDRENALARHKIDLHAPFLPGRPGIPSLPVIPLGEGESPGETPLAFLTIDLHLLKTSEEIVKAIRTALPETKEQAPARSYSLALPPEFAQRTGFSRSENVLLMPVDGRLEEFARRLVLSPDGFVAMHGAGQRPLDNAKDVPDLRPLLRLEGVKALRLFQSEKNLAIVRAWLDDPTSKLSFAHGQETLVPALPRNEQAARPIALPQELAQVPEVHFQEPLTKAMKTPVAQLHTAVTIDSVHLLNQKKTDGYIDTLMKTRPDLAGLPFAMGAKCRMQEAASRQFVAALDVFRKAASEDDNKVVLMGRYKSLSAEKKIDSSASVSSLMQVLGHEDANVRFTLVQYLDGVNQRDATRALAKLAIFSEESEIRSAAVKALVTRSSTDYTDILLAGLNYPWPAVAERASEALATLQRKELVPRLIDVLEAPDPRAPQTQDVNGKKVQVVRELVRLNHHHNCLLCHAPATTTRATTLKDDAAKLEGLTAQVPVPSESMVAYYRPSVPDILVRFDVTYLRQDFSLKLPVANANPWPEMQRYDFLVRTRAVADQEALALQKLLEPSGPDVLSRYRRAAYSALRQLTRLNTEPTATAWRKLLGL